MNDHIMMEQIRDLLPTELFGDSKDWREGNTVERVEWLLTMYASAKEEVEQLQDAQNECTVHIRNKEQ